MLKNEGMNFFFFFKCLHFLMKVVVILGYLENIKKK